MSHSPNTPMKQNIYIVSDTHYTNLHSSSPDECETVRNYVKRWNSKIRKHDLVIHLGDVVVDTIQTQDARGRWVSKNKDGINILQYLNGEKILVRGNHDTFKVNTYLKYFKEVHMFFEYRNILFSHAPVCPLWSKTHDFGNIDISVTDMPTKYAHIRANVHGHFHQYGIPQFKVTLHRPRIPYQETAQLYRELVRKDIHEQHTTAQQRLRNSVPYPMFCVNDTPVLLQSVLRQIRKNKKKPL